MQKTCEWPGNDPLMLEYHNTEWGVPVHDDHKLFEFLVLDAFQAGLSWKTILRKRENFRRAFINFDFETIATWGDDKVVELMQDTSIVRNRLKIAATIQNAKAFIKIREEFGSFDKFIWQFTDFKTRVNHWENLSEIPAKSLRSDAMSKALVKRGFKFVGSTICYAFMQAAGMINDHITTCFRYEEIKKIAD
jgi:DNA-3-methyladenine glycosylase I